MKYLTRCLEILEDSTLTKVTGFLCQMTQSNTKIADCQIKIMWFSSLQIVHSKTEFYSLRYTMAIKDSVQTHFLGPTAEVEQWGVYDWMYVSVRVAVLICYILLQALVSLTKSLVGFLVCNHLTNIALRVIWTLCGCIPLLGKYLQQLLPKLLRCITNKLLPALDKLSQLVELCFQLHIVEMTLKDKKNVQIFVTAESDEFQILDQDKKLMTTLLLANHRSICDYMLINYLIQSGDNSAPYTKKRALLKRLWCGEPLPFPKLEFITWGKIVNFPHLSMVKNIFIKDENYFVPPTKIKEHLSGGGNKVVAIFPEVNIMTTELGMIQRKLNQDYSFVAQFYNVLYPRFKGFVSVIKCFANINNVKNKQNHGLFSSAKSFINTNVDKFMIKVACQADNTIEQDYAQANMIVGEPNISIIGADNSFTEKQTENSQKESIKINNFLYDLTIVYYKPRYINIDRDHDHVNGQFRLHNGYQLEQVNPSLLEMLLPEESSNQDIAKYTTTKPPIVVLVNIRKHQLGPLLPAKGRNLEKWLEHQWLEKDQLIDCIERGITIR